MSDFRYSLARDEDREFFSRELDAFVPERIFDAHTHAWIDEGASWRIPGMPSRVGAREHRTYMEDLHPGRQLGAMFLPGFDASKRHALADCNAWVAEQAAFPTRRGAFFVTPQDDPEWVRQEVKRLQLHGLKCYHTFAASTPTWEAHIPEYLPEALVKVAHEEGWFITLHIVRSRAAADPSNQHWIRHYCQAYPDMKLILAHSARGFQPAHNLEGLEQLAGLDNLYCDSSANCEPMAHQAVLRILGHKRLMYGSDLPVSHLRGRSLAAADSFLWLYEETPIWGEKHARIQPVLVGLEHLRSLKWACWSERLTDQQIEDVFWNNAASLFQIN